MKFYISLVLTFLVAFVSAQDTIPGSFTVQNHGADYPQKGNYIFGERSKSADAKFIKDNRYLKVDGNRSYNGIMVYAISRTTLQYHSLKGDYSKHSLDNGISNRNGEHRFNWMITESEVDGAIVDSFVKFMTTIPEDHLVFMYSGYYHSIPTMPEKFYEAIERFGSKEIRRITARGVWAFIGSDCASEVETEEFYTNEQDKLISLQRSFSETCDVVVGSPETVHSDIRVYPNPGTDFVSVGVEKDPSTVVRVVDVNGRLYLQTQQVADIDISFLPKGVYLVNIRQKGRQITQMLVKD